MNLHRFRSAFTATDGVPPPLPINRDFGVPGLDTLLNELGGQSMNQGLYRVIKPDQVAAATLAMEAVFPEYRGRIVPFGFDWLGRHFACDFKRVESGHPLVLMLEVGVGEAMEIPSTLLDFHNVELVDYIDDVLATSFWRNWRTLNPAELTFNDCVGYKVPLFLGGVDVVENLERIDLNLYVELCGQLRNRALTLPQGQCIRNLTFCG